MIKHIYLFIFIISFKSNSQNLLWTLDFQDTTIRWRETIATDNNSNLYMSFTFGGTMDADPSSNIANHISNGMLDTCLVKFSPSGQYLWSVSFGGNNNEYPYKIVVDNEGNIIILGYSISNNIINDSNGNSINLNMSNGLRFILKYDSSGNLIWSRNFGNNSVYSWSIDFDTQNNLYLVGSFEGSAACDFDITLNNDFLTPIGNKDCYIMKINSDGYNVWTKQIGTINTEFFQTIKVNRNENTFCIIGGIDGSVDFDTSSNDYILSPVNGGNLVIAKYDLNSNFLWAKSFENLNMNSSLNGNKINFDSNNNIYFSGYFNNSVDFNPDLGQAIFNSTPISTVVYEDSFICKLDNNGNYISTKTLSSIYQDKVIDFDFDSNNNIFLIGEFKGTLNFDQFYSNYSLTSLGEYDAYFMKLDNNLNFKWAYKIGNNQDDDKISNIKIDNSNNILISGGFKGIMDIDLNNNVFNINNNSLTNYDSYVIKYNDLDLLGFENFQIDIINIFPNPCNDYLNILNKTNIDKIEIIDMIGKKVIDISNCNNLLKIDIKNLNDGFYNVIIHSNNRIYKNKILKI